MPADDWIEVSTVQWEVLQPKSATASTGGGHTAERTEHKDAPPHGIAAIPADEGHELRLVGVIRDGQNASRDQGQHDQHISQCDLLVLREPLEHSRHHTTQRHDQGQAFTFDFVAPFDHLELQHRTVLHGMHAGACRKVQGLDCRQRIEEWLVVFTDEPGFACRHGVCQIG